VPPTISHGQRGLQNKGRGEGDVDVDVPPLLAITLLRGSGVPYIDRGERGERVVLRLGAHVLLRSLDDMSRDSVEDGLPVGWRAILRRAGALVVSPIHMCSALTESIQHLTPHSPMHAVGRADLVDSADPSR
jgi:hypothetical protein